MAMEKIKEKLKMKTFKNKIQPKGYTRSFPSFFQSVKLFASVVSNMHELYCSLNGG